MSYDFRTSGSEPDEMTQNVNQREMARAISDLEQFLLAATVEFAAGVVELSNRGGDGAPPAPIDRGELRGSVRVTARAPSSEESPPRGPYPLTTEADVRRAVQLGGLGVRDVLWIRFIAAHANIIEGGRRVGSHGRMIGSEQAPDGWLWPGVEVQLVRMDRWSFRQ